MTTRYVTVEEIAGRSEKGYPCNVRKAVLTRLIKRGVLVGKKIDSQLSVAETDALNRVLGYGIENFVYNTQGWSCVAIHAPLEQVANLLRSLKGTLAYEAHITPQALRDDVQIRPNSERRDVFVVKMRGSDWTVIVQTVHWIQGSDPLMGLMLAAELSQTLKTQAAALWDDDFSGSHLVVCENGDKTQYLGDEANAWEDVHTRIYELGIHVPKCFIANEGDSVYLHVTDVAQVEQADHAVLAVPVASQVKVPHVLEKLSMMAGAMDEPPEDEAAFCDQMIEGLWRQAVAMRATWR